MQPRKNVRSLLSCAALGGACSLAAAQSSVTIFGIVDVAVGHLNNGTSGTTAPAGQPSRGPGLGAPSLGNPDQWSVRQSTASRLGFRGVEDLGGGLKALFNLEMRFTPDDGAASVPFFGGRSTVSLQNNWGELYLGRDYIPAFYVGITLDPWLYDLNVGALQTPYTLAGYSLPIERGVRTNNAMGFRSAVFNGFSVHLATSAGEGVRKHTAGANVQYRSGPVYAGLAVEQYDSDNRLAMFGGAYDFKVVRPMFVFARATVAGQATRSLGLGATAPVGEGVLKVAFGMQDPPGDGNTTRKFGLGYEYFLSKRTSVHADVGTAKHPDFSRVTGFEVGIKQVF